MAIFSSRMCLLYWFFLCLVPVAQAENLFSADVFVDGQQDSLEFSQIDDLLDQSQPDNIKNVLENYTDNSLVFIGLDIRGIDALVHYPANSSEIHFEIPALNFRRVFDVKNTRFDNQQDFDTFIKENKEDLLSRILRLAVAETPLDPVAGNPNSLVGEMIATDFSTAMSTNVPVEFMSASNTEGETIDAAVAAAGSQSEQNTNAEDENKNAKKKGANSIFVGLNAGRFSIDGHNHDVLTIPLAYTYYFEDPRYQLRFDAPITMMKIDNSTAYRGSLGAGLRIPLAKDWAITPAFRIGAVGSEDIGAAAYVYSASLTSKYNFYWKDYVFTLGNMLGTLKTGSIESGDYKVDYDLQNHVLKNGLSMETASNVKLLGKPTSWNFSLAHTLIEGDKSYVDSYYDLAFSFGHRKKLMSTVWNDLRAGITYTKGNNDYQSFMLNFGYKF